MIKKAELHLHLEGALHPKTAKKLAARHGLHLEDALFRNENVYAWKDFIDFLGVYEAASRVIKTPEDYRDVTYDYLMQSAKEGVIYCEMMPSPDHAALAGLSYQSMLEGVVKGIDDARREGGIEGRIVITGVRHFGAEKCEAVANLAVNQPHPYVVGYAIGGDELGFPPKQFARAYAIAHEAGLGTMCHAGEWSPPEGIWEALNYLPIQRIGHGVRAIEDADLIKAIIDRGVTLEVAPGSNIALGVYKSYAEHPLRRLYDAGVKVCLNSDDPPFFDTTVGQEYDRAEKVFGFTPAELTQVTRMAIENSFADEETKRRLLTQL